MLRVISTACKYILLGIIWGYSKFISPMFPPTCRYEPTCSVYAKQAIAKYGPGKGLIMALKRIARCHPFHPGGYDPLK